MGGNPPDLGGCLMSKRTVIDTLMAQWVLNGKHKRLMQFILDSFQSDGLFGLYQMPDKQFIHTLKAYYKSHKEGR